jgi:hypothetical protein
MVKSDRIGEIVEAIREALDKFEGIQLTSKRTALSRTYRILTQQMIKSGELKRPVKTEKNEDAKLPEE